MASLLVPASLANKVARVGEASLELADAEAEHAVGFEDSFSESPSARSRDLSASSSSLSNTSDLFAQALDLELHRAKLRQGSLRNTREDKQQALQMLERPCVMWLQGQCAKGNLCPFRHVSKRERHEDRAPEQTIQGSRDLNPPTPTRRRLDPAATALAHFAGSTGGKIMFKIRMDWHTGPRVATLDNRGGGATVRLWLQGGSGIRHSDNIADPSAPQPSPIAILRIRQSPGMEREQNETTGGNREEAEAGLDVLNLANACSTPLKRGCQHTTEPVWNFESGFFIFDTQHATLEISVWDAAQLRRQEAARWELAEEFIQLHTHGVVARAYLGSVLVELKHFESKAGRILVQEHHLMIPRMNARFLQALRLLQAVVRRQQPEVARSVLLLRRRLGPVRRGGKISLTIAAARNLPRRRSKDLQQLPKQMRKMMTHFVSAHSGAAKPSAFVHVSALDAFSHAATLVTAAVCSTSGSSGGGGNNVRGVAGGSQAVCTPLQRFEFDPVWTHGNSFTFAIPPDSDCVALSLKVYDRFLEGMTLSESNETSSPTSAYPDRLIGEALILRDDLFGTSEEGQEMHGASWLPIRREDGTAVRGGEIGRSGEAAVLVEWSVVGQAVEDIVRRAAQIASGAKRHAWRHACRERRAQHSLRTQQRMGPFTALLRDNDSTESSLSSDDEGSQGKKGMDILLDQDGGGQLVVWKGGKGNSDERDGARTGKRPMLLLTQAGEEGSLQHHGQDGFEDGSAGGFMRVSSVTFADTKEEQPGDDSVGRGEGEGLRGEHQFDRSASVAASTVSAMSSDAEGDTDERNDMETDDFYVRRKCIWDPTLSRHCGFKGQYLAATSETDWNFQSNLGACAVCSHLLDDTMREYTMRLRFLKRGSYQGIHIGLTQMTKNDVFWGKPSFHDKVWWFDTSSGVIFNGDERVTEAPSMHTDGTPASGRRNPARDRHALDAGDVFSFTLDLGASETTGGKWIVAVNGKTLAKCDNVRGPVRFAVQMMSAGDAVADASYKQTSDTASRAKRQRKRERAEAAKSMRTPVDLGAWHHSSKHLDDEENESKSDTGSNVSTEPDMETGQADYVLTPGGRFLGKPVDDDSIDELHRRAATLQAEIDAQVRFLRNAWPASPEFAASPEDRHSHQLRPKPPRTCASSTNEETERIRENSMDVFGYADKDGSESLHMTKNEPRATSLALVPREIRRHPSTHRSSIEGQLVAGASQTDSHKEGRLVRVPSRPGRGRGLDEQDQQRPRDEMQLWEPKREKEESDHGHVVAKVGEEERRAAVRKIEQGTKDLRRMLWRLTRLEEQQRMAEEMSAETPAAQRFRAAKMQAEIDAMRAKIAEREVEHEELEQELQDRQYALAKSRHRTTTTTRGKIMHDKLVVHPLTEQQLIQQADEKRDDAIEQRSRMFEQTQVRLRNTWLKIADTERDIAKLKADEDAAEELRLRQLKVSKTAPTAKQRAAAKEKALDHERQVLGLVKLIKRARKTKENLLATARNLERESIRTTQVLTSISAIASRQQKERDAEARRERHDQGAFTPILLTTAHQSPGHHVYDRHEALTQAERAALTLAGRNARSRNLTPILASVQEDAQGLPEEHDTMPHHPGFRRAQMQWRASLKQQEAEAKKAAEKQRISHGYMRDDKQTTVVLSQPGTPAGGTPVSFALSTPTFKLGTPLIPPTPAKALMGVSTGTPVVENQGQKK